jgi:hypothetical protein
MEEKTTGIEKIIIGLCLGVLMLFAFTVAVRFFTRQVLIKHYHMDNSFTEFVWFDNDEAADDGTSVVIDWEAQYPIEDSAEETSFAEMESAERRVTAIESVGNKINRLVSLIETVEEKLESYTSDLLVFHAGIVEYASYYERCVGWNFASFDEYNGVVQLSDGYLSSYVEKKDITQQYDELVELNAFCQEQSIDFLYVQAPYKISEYDDSDVSGTLDFSNQNVNDLLKKLDAADIDYYDIRETIHENQLYNHDLFYKTDHHWLTTTGLWASQNILAFCNETYGWNADLSLLDADRFDYTTYENWFLGSQGKKVTLSRCQPDDITLFYPKYETSFRYYVPAEGIDTTGDYSVVYDMTQISNCDYYYKNPYGACNYGDQPLIKIENQLNAEDHKILIIRDSFGDCMISCLALAEKNVDALDLRYFTGSVKAYIEESEPDLVIVMYTPSSVGGEINYAARDGFFDFR